MKLVRGLIKVAVGLVVVAVALAIVALFFLGPLVKTTVNTVGPKVLGVPVRVTHAAIYPLSGSVRLEGVTIGNPEGYSSDSLFTLKEVRIHVDITSLPGKGPIVIKEFAIIEPRVAYEVAGGKSNIEALTAALPKSEKPDEPQPAQNKPEPRKVIIDLLEFRDGQLTYRAKMTLGRALPLPLPNLRLTDIGRSKGGIQVADAVTKVLLELLNVVGTVVAKVGTAVLDTGKAAINVGRDAAAGGVEAIKSAESAAKGFLRAVRGDQ